MAGMTAIKGGKSYPFKLNLITEFISNKYHPDSSPGKSGFNFPCLYNL
jgi:hypothetical protein